MPPLERLLSDNSTARARKSEVGRTATEVGEKEMPHGSASRSVFSPPREAVHD